MGKKGDKEILGDEDIPTGGEWIAGGSSSSDCQVLSKPASITLFVKKIVIRRAPPINGTQKICISAFEVTKGWRIDIGQRVGIVSHVTLEDSADTQTIKIDPPVRLQRGQYVAIWNYEGSNLNLFNATRRVTMGVHEKGFWTGPRPVADPAKLTRWMCHSTSWYCIATAQPPAKKKKTKRYLLDDEPILQECTEEERLEKEKWLSREEEPAEEMILS